jgi:hypothetical protein
MTAFELFSFSFVYLYMTNKDRESKKFLWHRLSTEDLLRIHTQNSSSLMHYDTEKFRDAFKELILDLKADRVMLTEILEQRGVL